MEVRPLFPDFLFTFYRLLLPGEDSWVEQLFIVINISEMPEDYDWTSFWEIIGQTNYLGLDMPDWKRQAFFFDVFLAEKLAKSRDTSNVIGIETTASYYIYEGSYADGGCVLDGGSVIGTKCKVLDERFTRAETVQREFMNLLQVNGVPLKVNFWPAREIELERDLWQIIGEEMAYRPEFGRQWMASGPDRGAILTFSCKTPIGA